MGASLAAAVPLPNQAARWVRWHLPRYSLAGTTGAVLFGCVSFTPSLLPRDWILQGVVGGLSASFGYGLGVFLAWLGRAVSGWAPSARATRRLWALVALLGGPLLGWTLWLGQGWQRQIHALTGERPPNSYAWVRILLVTGATFLTVVAVARALRWVVRLLTGWLLPVVPERLAPPIAVVILVVLLVGLNDGVVSRGLVSVANSAFASVNVTPSKWTVRPLVPERSGSPMSLVPWAELGRRGQEFVSSGPDVRRLTAFSGAPAKEPVRVYVGLNSGGTTAQRAALAVRELRRAGGFDRAVLVVANTTGTGLVDPAAARAIEYMYNGDTAIVGFQYSYLPSWMSFLVDAQKAEQAGRQFFAHVYDAWSALPAGHRPKLLVTGSSLGAFGGESAFSGLRDMRRKTDGAVWAGPPYSSALHEYLVQHRDPGTPERLPVYHSGRAVRFAATPQDLRRPTAPWHRPRVVYLQNGSDPIVYWSPRLLFEKPDWLSEPRAPDVSPDMFWIPVVSFWQVSADLPFALDLPSGHGHDYRGMFADAWAAVAPPPGWTAQDTQRLKARLSSGP